MHWHSVSLSGLKQRTQRPKVSSDCSGSAGVKAEPEEMQRNGQLRMGGNINWTCATDEIDELGSL